MRTVFALLVALSTTCVGVGAVAPSIPSLPTMAEIAKPKVAQTYINAQVEPASSTPGELAALVAAETANT